MKKLILASLLALVFSGCSILTNAPTNRIPQCERGNAKVCVEVANYYTYKRDEATNPNDRRLFRNKAVQFYSKACDFKNEFACFDAARNDDRKEAIKYYKKACDLSHTNACVEVAEAYAYGKNSWDVKQDLQKAQEYYKKSGYKDTYSVLTDYLEKLPSYEKSCESNDVESCVEAGRIHSESNFIKEYKTNARLRYERAVALLEQNCKRGNNAACIRVSGLYSYVSIMRDFSKAATFLELVCKRGDNAVCFKTGILYYQTGSNYPKAVEFFNKACKNGHSEACHHLGICYNEGKGVQTNLSKAKQYYHKACNVGIAEACKKLMVITNMGLYFAFDKFCNQKTRCVR